MVRPKPRLLSVERDRIFAELLLRWSRSLDEHGLSFEMWLTLAGTMGVRVG
jgi:hypothetical protein